MTGVALMGREHESASLAALVAGVSTGGGCLVVRGEVGVGKSALLQEAADLGLAQGMRVLRAVGVQAETRLPFGGIDQLLRPVLLHDTPGPSRARETVLTALGLTDGTVAQLFGVARAVLELLTDIAQARPLLLVVDDAQWLDQPSWDVLAFVGRRLRSDPVVALVGMRAEQEPDSRLSRAGLGVLEVEPLTDIWAAALLDSGAPDLAPPLRRRILAEADGNPLGLLELPAAATRFGEGALLPAWLPLTTRLENTFVARVAELPAVTRALLLTAAVDEVGVLDDVLSATAMVLGRPVTEDDLAPAVAARLIEVGDLSTVQFRHPLVRSAVSQNAQVGQRRLVHAALAEVLRQTEDRSVWHRAAATSGPADDVARDLVAAAARARRRGARDTAARALERAAELSTDPAERGARLLQASDLRIDLGDHDGAARLIQEIDESALVAADRAQLAWVRELYLGTGWSGAARLAVFAGIADTMRIHGDTERALDYLVVISLRAWWSNPDQHTRALVAAVADRLPGDPSDPRRLAVLALAEPVERGARLLARLESVVDTVADPEQLFLLAQATSSLGAFGTSGRLFAQSVAGLRDQSGGGVLARARACQAWNAVHTGDTRLAITAAAEGAELSVETGQSLWGLTAQLAGGAADALRGHGDSARSVADAGERVLLLGGAHPMLALVQLIRGVEALGANRHEEAYQALHRVFDPADLAYHPYVRFWLVAHLAEAGVNTDHRGELLDLLRNLGPVATATRSPVLRVGLAYARALLADAADAETHFRDALAGDLAAWPFERARAQLAYGTWLRRRRRPAESRPHLRGAELAFEALGTVPWAERARRELRASGETVRRVDDMTEHLTPQELQIAQLAAGGLSNRQIAESLFLSARTVSTHLYRIYPKLRITSRTHLAAALVGGGRPGR